MRTLILLLGFALCVFAKTSDAGDQTLPAYEGLSEINLFAGEGGFWHLTIYRDGSGHIDWGNSPRDYAKFPPRTFEFGQVYHTMAPRALPDAAYTDPFTMSLRQGHSADVSMYHFKQGEAILALFDKAMHDCNNKDRIAELWQRYSPLIKP